MKKAIIEAIQTYDTIIIHRHVRPDPDALGSQNGLAAIIRESFPNKTVYTVGDMDDSLDFMGEMDAVSDDVYNGALVIVCDTANQPRVSDQRFKNGAYLIKIDHHPNDDPYGDITWVETSSSSTSEMIYDLYLANRDGLQLNQEAGRMLYAGIVGDTGRFMFANTTKRTHRYAGELIETGFDRQAFFNQLYKRRREVLQLQGYVLQHFTLLESGVGYMTLTMEDLAAFNVTTSEASLLVNAFSDVEGIRTWAFFVEEPDQIRVRLRSKGPVINTVANQFNGGGHPMASGATIYSWDDKEAVIRALEEACERDETTT